MLKRQPCKHEDMFRIGSVKIVYAGLRNWHRGAHELAAALSDVLWCRDSARNAFTSAAASGGGGRKAGGAGQEAVVHEWRCEGGGMQEVRC